MKCDKIFSCIDTLQNKYIKLWIDACNIESPTDFKEGVDKCGKLFIDKAKELGFEIDIHTEEVSGNAVCITMNPESKERPVVFSGHIDTVHPLGLFGTPATHCNAENIYGPGVVDCKGGVVAGLLAMEALKECGFTSRPVKLFLQSDEENGSRFCDKRTVKYMYEKSRDAIAFLNTESYHPGQAILTRKGILKYSFEITGKAAHASKCYEGTSAIAEAAYKIAELEKLKDPEGLTCNCGLISGGTAENTVPEKCTFTADIRFATQDEMNRAKALAEEIAEKSVIGGTTCNLKLASYRVAMEKNDKNILLLDKINEIYKENNIPLVAPSSGNGGSDASDMSAYGVPSIDCMGVEGKSIHSINECARLSSLAESAKRLASVAYCI